MNRRPRLVSKSKSRSGFTLIELLVVIAIIGTLVAMLLPAVQMAREAARRNTCSVNQKNLGLALQNYAGARKFYPGYRDSMTVSGLAAPIPVSWLTMLLPNLDQRNIYDQIRLGNLIPSQPTSLPYLELMACPSDPQDLSKPSTSYAVNCGLADVNPAANSLNGSGASFQLVYPGDSPANGAFVSRYEFAPTSATPAIVPAGKLQRVTPDGFYDGTSNTILLSESLDATVWNDTLSIQATNGYNTSTGATPEINSGIIWYPMSVFKNPNNPTNTLFINGGTSEGGEAQTMYDCRPSSKHPGGVNVTYADGRTVFVNENLDYLVYCLLMSPEGKKVNPAGVAFQTTANLITNYPTEPWPALRTNIVTSSDVP